MNASANTPTTATGTSLALRADSITITFGGLVAVDNVSFTIPDRGSSA